MVCHIIYLTLSDIGNKDEYKSKCKPKSVCLCLGYQSSLLRSVRKTRYDEGRCAFIPGKSLRMIERMMEEPDSQPYKEERERKDRDHPRSWMIRLWVSPLRVPSIS